MKHVAHHIKKQRDLLLVFIIFLIPIFYSIADGIGIDSENKNGKSVGAVAWELSPFVHF